MESTNLCVALRAMIDLWIEKQRKVLAAPLAWHSQASTHWCPSLHRARHDAQLWDYAQPAA